MADGETKEEFRARMLSIGYMSRILIVILSVLLTLGLVAVSASASTTPDTCSLTGTGDNCGPYLDNSIPMSNGSNTYVAVQNVGANTGTTGVATVNDANNWSALINAVPYGYGGVQIFLQNAQDTNNWNGNGWGNGDSDTPLAALSALKVNYTENMGTVNANTSAEFAPDIWTDNYPSDVMFWADTSGRCDSGSYGSTVLGTAVIDGQTWTVNRYGGPGEEVIFVLDSNPSVPNSCANQTSGSIDIQAGLNWLVANGDMTGPVVVNSIATGWEITSAQNETFSLSNYSITATVGPKPPVVYATNPPTNLHVVTDKSNYLNVAWDATANATSYTARLVQLNGVVVGRYNIGNGQTFANWGSNGVPHPGWQYHVQVWANPTYPGGPHATLLVTIPKVSVKKLCLNQEGRKLHKNSGLECSRLVI